MANLSETLKLRTIEAGGPGSGRHEGYGKFVRVGSGPSLNTWKHEATKTKVSLHDTYGPKGRTVVKENGKKQMSTDKDGEAEKFLSTRYGIKI